MHLKKSLSVIIPNYNGKHLLEKYLPSVFEALLFEEIDYEIIVIDDASKDDSPSFLKNNYPSIILLLNDENKGFSKTCNKGIIEASKELILLLNTDVKLEKDYFKKQWKYFENDTTFGVMGKIMSFDNTKIEDAARLPRFKGAKFKADTFYYSNEKDDLVYTAYLSGANALVNREKLIMIGGFDEIYSPFYFEDFDLSLRAWQMGWKCYYEQDAICYHHISASTNIIAKKSNFVKIIYNRNSFTLQAIHLQGFKKFLWYLQLHTTTLFNHLIKGEFWILKSFKQFIKSKKQIEFSILKNKQLQEQVSSNFNLNDLIKTIQTSIEDKNITQL